MRGTLTIDYIKRRASSLIMLLALAWLTVSLPYVYSFQQEVKKELSKSLTNNSPSDENTNPLTNTNEEKTESSANTLSEYLHDTHPVEHHFISLSTYYKCHSSDLYFAFHPDTLSPPPDQA